MPSANSSSKKISHYQLDKLLVEQMAGAIYLARNEKDDQQVFLITLQPDAAKSNDLIERFQRRAKTLAQLDHDALLPLLDHGIDGKRPFAVMAHIPGQFLSAKLDRAAQEKNDSPDKSETIAALNLVKQLAAGLSATHATGLIHHDLRPENIYLNEAGCPYLLDLVIPPTAAPAPTSGSRRELDYQSPEQIEGKILSGRSNIYSLGILLYRLLAGQKPALPVSEWDIFEHKGTARAVPLNKVRTDLSAATYDVVRNCIWQKEWSRFETAEALIEAVDVALNEESTDPLPLPIWLRFFHWLKQPKLLRIAIPAIIFLFILVLLFVFMRGRAARQGNMTPTPKTAVLPLESEADTSVLSEPENTPTPQPTELPATATKSPTALPSPSQTAVPTTATEPPATEAASATPQSTIETATPTETSCTPSPPFGWTRYQIQANDSLSKLAQSNNTTVERLQEVNCLDSILLSIGQAIWLPFAPTATAEATLPPATAVPTNNAPPPNPAPTNPPPQPTSPPATPTPPTAP